MIGLSVPLCIRDIVEGKVLLENVEKIVSDIAARTPEEIDNVVRRYRDTYWRKHPDESEKLFRELLADGKIEQPRLTEENRSPTLSVANPWVESEDQIDWWYH